MLVIMLVTLLVLVVVIAVIIIALARKKRIQKSHDNRNRGDNFSVVTDGAIGDPYMTGPCNTDEPIDSNEFSQTISGKGDQLLMKQTVSRQLTWIDPIGYGRFGQVWKCSWQGMEVAVKCCTTKDEKSWKKESLIYQTTMLRHDNLLGFIAADIHDNDGTLRMIVITEYHQRGSLHTFLVNNVISIEQMLKFCISVANGLNHLHTIIQGTRTKPGIAHRDLKSKNVLVKNNGEACLCDLGLAILYDPEPKDPHYKFEIHHTKVGTHRYMAPEVLTEEISHHSFEGFKLADIYALALLLWEILSRCELEDGDDVSDYHEPYYGMVPPDPTFEHMVQVVVTQGRRPHMRNNWRKHFATRTVVELISACWKHSPQSRLTALRVSKNISAISEISASTTSTTLSALSVQSYADGAALESTYASSGHGEASVVSHFESSM